MDKLTGQCPQTGHNLFEEKGPESRSAVSNRGPSALTSLSSALPLGKNRLTIRDLIILTLVCILPCHYYSSTGAARYYYDYYCCCC